MPDWTPEQAAAITARGVDLLVAAAAGAGKTAVLVERIIRRITDPVAPVDVDRLLVVTFTEAAAAEMRQRIAAALQEALAADPENARLQRQLTLLGRASIFTLHAFCLGCLRQYFYRLGLDPAPRVMGEHEAALLRQDVLAELFEAAYQEGDAAFLDLVERYGGQRGDEALQRLVFELHDRAQSLPWPDVWLQQAAARFAVGPDDRLEDTPWWPPLGQAVALELAGAVQVLDLARALAAQPGGPAAYADVLQADRAQVAAALQAAAGGYADLCAAVAAIGFATLPPVRNDAVDADLKERVQGLRGQAKQTVAALARRLLGRPAADWLADLRALHPHMQALVDLVGRFEQAYAAAKAAQGVVDFTDLERHTLRLLADAAAPPGELRPSDAARELRRRFVEVLVDEYQDINGVQDAILTLVARDEGDGAPNRFMVGDVKQSIYGFRQTDPRLFLQKYNDYTGADAAGRRIVLGANFRSRTGVIAAVNFVFRQLFAPAVAELAYDRAAELVAAAAYPPLPGEAAGAGAAPPVEVHILESDARVPAVDAETGEVNGDGGAPGGAEREALLIARRIAAMVRGDGGEPLQVYDAASGGYRALCYRDIAILLRATTAQAAVFSEALSRAGIPVYAQSATGYFAATEVEVMLSLLRLLDNPRQDIPLAAVLRSPLVGLSAQDLAQLRLAAAPGAYYDAVRAGMATLEGRAAAALELFLRRLEAWRTAARRGPLGRLIWQIYQETGYLHYVAGMPGGAQRRANLVALYDRARQFDQFSRQGLFRFLRFIERLRAGAGDMGVAPALGEAEDVVRIMSIHKSKGLEFPVVFIAQLGRALNLGDAAGDLPVHRDLGLGPMVVDPELRVRYPSLAYLAVQRVVRLQSLAEEMRVLYVGLTRARERLVLVGSVPDLGAAAATWAQAASVAGWTLPEPVLAGARRYLDWLGPALCRHGRDGAALRRLGAGPAAAADPSVAADPARWQVVLWSGTEEIASSSPVEAPAAALDWARIASLAPLQRPVEPAVRQQLQQRFAWRYPYAALGGLLAKMSVTELKGHFQPDPDAAPPPPVTIGLDRRPRFRQEAPGRLTPAERGAAVHLVLQHLNLTGRVDAAGIVRQVEDLAARGLITPRQAAAVDAEAIAAFFAGDLGQRLRARPERLQREVTFTLGLPVGLLYPEQAAAAPPDAAAQRIVVQGMIDYLFEDETGYVLIDFKTDGRAAVNLPAATRRHAGQMQLYMRAVAQILQRPVAEAWLHFLAAGRSVPVMAETGRE